MVATAAYAQQFINILTGGTSGVYYPLGNALSAIYAKALPDARVTVQATKASVENLNLIQAGRGEVAFTLGDSLTLAAKDDAEMGFAKPLDKLRTIAAIYPNYIQMRAFSLSRSPSTTGCSRASLSSAPAVPRPRTSP